MTEDIRNKKKELRKKILALRDVLPLEERQSKSKSIHSRLFSLPEFVAAKSVAFFVSFRGEVLTESMMREALDLGKVVVVPITDLTNRTPGVVFDLKGCRIGYGGGFYDGLLKSLKKKRFSVGLAFELQIVEGFPVDRNRDEPVDIIITEKRVIRCRE